jgi:hypothetical protein
VHLTAIAKREIRGASLCAEIREEIQPNTVILERVGEREGEKRG